MLRAFQCLTRLRDRVQHAERRLFTAHTRREIRFAIAGKERVGVRVDEAWNDDAIPVLVQFGGTVLRG